MKTSTKYLKLLVNLVIFVLTICFFIFVLPRLIVFFMPFVIGWIISVIANPLVRMLEKRVKLLRRHSSMIIIISVLALLIAGGYFAIARVGGEVLSLVNNLPEIYESASIELEGIGEHFQVVWERLPENIQDGITSIKDSFSSYIGDIVGMAGKPTVQAAGNFAKNLPSRLIAVIMTVLSSYFFIADRDKILDLLDRAVPWGIKRNVGGIVDDFKNVVGGYFRAQFKIMFIVAFILFAGFTVLGVNYAILLAILIAILDFLPFFGTGTALIPWAAVKALSSDYKMAVGLLIIYAVSQLIRQLIQPKIVGDTIGLDPLSTLFFMYIGYKVKGVLGMIIAVPVGMIVINLYKKGAFDGIIKNTREILKDINRFRQI